MTQHNKQARQTFHCFVLNSHFIQPSECKSVLFVCLSVRLQVSFIPLRFRYFVQRFFRTVDLSRENRVMPPTLRFSRKRIEIIFRGRCRPRKLKSAKKIPIFSRQNRENLATRKYPTLRYELSHEKMCVMSYGNNKGADPPAHRLISAFVVRCLDSITSLDSIAELANL